jgi:hypothetical protein
MVDLNPFPDYAVVNLTAEANQVRQDTIPTPAIREARERVRRYTQQWLDRKSDPTRQVEPLITAVRGDYGTGKTHLLLDATAQFQDALAPQYPDVTSIRVACLETDPLTWFRLGIGQAINPAGAPVGPKIGPNFIERLMLRLYAEAGRTVAGKTKLTEGAVERLIKEPEAIQALVKDNLLNGAAVDEEFGTLLQKVCEGTNEDVRRALAATVWIDTSRAALRWLAAEQLTETELRGLHLSSNLSNGEEASGVLAALAALHRHLETPFMLIIDELEHLTRYDLSRHSNGNITWLKRLLERLAAHHVITFVSGHWSGWKVQSDFLDRFTQLGFIELVKLTDEDVLRIVQARVPTLDATSFGELQAKSIARNSDGNIRRVLTLCGVLFRETDGFRTPLTPEQIEQSARKMGQRITIEEATLSLRTILEQEGLDVRAQSATEEGIIFDLIGYLNDHVRVVAEFEHAVHQADLLDQAKVFLDRVEEIFKTEPSVVGCFIADGNIDDELGMLLKAARPFKLLWYDMTKSEVMTQIASDLRQYLHGSGPPADLSAADLTARKDQNEELMAQLEGRIKAASTDANAGLVEQLQDQRSLLEQQLAKLNEQLSQREANMRAEFLKSLKVQVEELDAKRNDELKRLYERLETERQNAPSNRDEEVLRPQEGEDSPKLHATYTELTGPPHFKREVTPGSLRSPTVDRLGVHRGWCGGIFYEWRYRGIVSY